MSQAVSPWASPQVFPVENLRDHSTRFLALQGLGGMILLQFPMVNTGPFSWWQIGSLCCLKFQQPQHSRYMAESGAVAPVGQKVTVSRGVWCWCQ